MPRGDKSSYTNKQKRKAQHIEEGYMERGLSRDEAERRAWAHRQQGKRRRQQERIRSRRAGQYVVLAQGRPPWRTRCCPSGRGPVTVGAQGRENAKASHGVTLKKSLWDTQRCATRVTESSMTMRVFADPCCCTSANSTAALDGCSRTQPFDARDPSCATAVVP